MFAVRTNNKQMDHNKEY